MLLEQTIAVQAARQFNSVVQQISDSQWSMTLPDDFQAATTGSSLRHIINEHCYDDAWIPEMLAGKSMDEVGVDRWKGDLLGDDPKANFEEYCDRAIVAIEKLEDPETTVHCSFGDYTARQFLQQVCTYRGLRSYDVARVLGLDTQLPDDLVQGLWEIIEPNAEQWRSYGVYGPAIDVSADAPLQQRLLGLTGYK